MYKTCHNHTEDSKADLVIKKPFYGAFKVFNWQDKDWGWGISLDKLENLEKKGLEYVDIELQKPEDTYKVKLTHLKAKLKKRNSFNQNGPTLCGYVTKPDITELARRIKGTNRAED